MAKTTGPQDQPRLSNRALTSGAPNLSQSRGISHQQFSTNSRTPKARDYSRS